MARKQLLPEVIAEREQAYEEYRASQRAAVERIARLRELRLANEAMKATTAKAPRKGQSGSERR